MKLLTPSSSWPSSWLSSFHYDRMEIYGENARSGYSYAYNARRREILDLVRLAASPGARILDLAAAQGNFTLVLAELGYEVTWNDLRADLAEYVRLKHERGTIHFAPGNAFELEFSDAFDVVLIGEVIEHVAHPDQFLQKVATLVRPGGHIVMSTPNGEYFRNRLPKFSECPDTTVFEDGQFKPDSDGHIFLLHVDEVEGMALKAGLEVREIRLFTNPLSHGHIKLGRLLPLLPVRTVEAIERFTRRLPSLLGRKIHTSTVALLRRPSA